MLQKTSSPFTSSSSTSSSSSSSSSTRNNRLPPLQASSSSDPYRVLGLTPNTTPQEFYNRLDELRLKYKDDPVQLSVVNRANDQIYQMNMDKAIELNKTKKRTNKTNFGSNNNLKTKFGNLQRSLYKSSKGLIIFPEKKYLQQTTLLLGSTLLGSVFATKSSSSFLMVAFALSFGFLNTRGAPPVPKDEFGEEGRKRPGQSRSSILKSFGVILFCSSIFAILAAILMDLSPEYSIFRRMDMKTFVNSLVIFGLWVACTFFKTWEAEA